MATEISGRNFDITPEIRTLLETKLAKIQDKLFDDVIVFEVCTLKEYIKVKVLVLLFLLLQELV